MRFERPPSLPDLILVEPEVHRDQRGFLFESYHMEKYRAGGIPSAFVQDNCSVSERGVLRGLHFQNPHGQGKLVRVVHGEVFDVAVDVRTDSPTFGRWFGTELRGDDIRQLYVPPGFAHGFLVLGESAEFTYKCTDFYHPEAEHTLLWNDPALGIDWPLAEPRLSEKDRRGKTLDELRILGVLPDR